MRRIRRKEIKFGNSEDIEKILYPHNNDTEQTDAEILINPDLHLIDCCSAFEGIEERRFRKYSKTISE